jgi:RNA polymerase sigma factor (sigma-70 family)
MTMTYDTATEARLPEAARSDAELTARIREGSPQAVDDALAELYRRHHAAVLSYARSCTRDEHTAEDLASEAFTGALQAVRGGAGPETAWRAYLLVTVRRTAASWAVGERRNALTPDFDAWLSKQAVGESGEERTLRRADAELVLRAFRRLPENWQTVLWHSAVEGEPPRSIAPLLGISASGVRSLTARAREGLREAYLAEYAAGPGDTQECRHFTGLLAASVRREGRHHVPAGLRHHLADCRQCRRAHRQMRELSATLSAVLPAGLLLWLGATYRTKAVAATAATTGTVSAVKVGAVGAGLLAACVGGYLLLPGSDDAPSGLSPGPAGSVHARPATPTPSRSLGPTPRAKRATAPASRTPSEQVATPSSSRTPSWRPAADDQVALPIVSTGTCMDIGTAQGAEPHETTCDGSPTQVWDLLVDKPDHEVRLRNHATGMCLTNSGTAQDGAPVRQERSACTSTAATARWTYFVESDGRVSFQQKENGGYFLGLNEWDKAADGKPHSPVIGTTANYYGSPSLRFRYTGHAFDG